MAGEIRIGTSGWQYPDWRGRVYPDGVAPSHWLSHYVTWFPTVEVNATFYRLAREGAARRWCDTAPPGFEFALKQVVAKCWRGCRQTQHLEVRWRNGDHMWCLRV